jgi:two-component system, LytTR family, sensor kinase
MQLPQYNGKDNKVMLGIVPAGAFAINCIAFGSQYFSSFVFFLSTTLASTVALGLFFITCGAVAVSIKNRFPAERQAMKRLSLMILTFIVMSGLFLYALFNGYASVSFFKYHFDEQRFAWAYFALGVVNIFLTLLMEGIARYQEWEVSRLETAKLNEAIKKSQLDGLKSQVNPHFLFNSLNTLSSLIQEDEAKAERFLDEMSKVYRYMLRDDAQWVSLKAELKFMRSYLHLLHARFGEGLQVEVQIPESAQQQGIAPRTLQVLIENAFSQNIISKNRPLHIELRINPEGDLIVRNNVQPKKNLSVTDPEISLDLLIAKYKLLKCPIAVDDSEPGFRSICIPLIFQETNTLS